MSDSIVPSPVVAPVKRGRGRPRVHADDAARQAAYRDRHDYRQLNVNISAEVMLRLEQYMVRQSADGAGLSLSQVVEKLLLSQLLRKR